MSMAAAITQLFTFDDKEDESRRIASDPLALADLSTQALRRHDDITISKIRAEQDRVRNETEMYCQELDYIIEGLQQQAAPRLQELSEHINRMAALRDNLARYRAGTNNEFS